MQTRKKYSTIINNVVVVPLCAEEIEVCWKQESDNLEWWTAQVVRSQACKKGRVVGTGTIRYEQRDDYKETIHEVEFLFDKRFGRLVRESGKARKCECAWKLVGEDSASIPCGDTNESSAGTASNVRLDSTETCSPSSKKKRKLASSSADGLSQISVDSALAQVSRRVPVTHSNEHASKTLASLMGDMLRNYKPGSSDDTNATQYRDPTVSIASAVKAELKYLLAERFSSNSTVKSTALRSIEEGAIVNNICISTRCCLSWFIDVVNDIHSFSTEHNTNSLSFLPSFNQITRPSRATQKLSVCFDDFVSLCSWLDLREKSDVDKMICRKKMEGTDFYISIIGATSSEDINSETSAKKENTVQCDVPCSTTTDKTEKECDERSYNEAQICCLSTSEAEHQDAEPDQYFTIDRVLVGNSAFRQSNGSSSSSSFRTVDTLQQHRKTWDDSQARFVDEWKLIPERIDKCCSKFPQSEVGEAVQQCIGITWKRLSRSSSRRLSIDAFDTGNITLGKIELNIPTVTFVGPNTCEQVNSKYP